MAVLVLMFNTDSKHDEQHIVDLGFRNCLVKLNVFFLQIWAQYYLSKSVFA